MDDGRLHILLVTATASEGQDVLEALRRGLPTSSVSMHAGGAEHPLALPEAPYEVAILDASLGREQAVELLLQLKLRWPQLSAVVLTGPEPDEEAYGAAAELGADEYLPKTPATVDYLPRLVRVVHERVQQKQQLVAALAALREAHEAERQLIGIVAHDLRGPLQAVLLSAASLGRRRGLEEPVLKGLRRIESSALRATRIVSDVLDFTQARLGGGIALACEEVYLQGVVERVVEELRVVHPTRPLQVEAQEAVRGWWDAERLAQVVANLMGNALAYSPADTPVVVRVRQEAEEAVLEVHNLGAPIPAETLPRLFLPLQRGEARARNPNRSLGLGLYIVRHLVEAHGGRVTATSSSEAGTTFQVRLPRRADSATSASSA